MTKPIPIPAAPAAMPEIMNLSQVCSALGLSRTTVWKLCREKKLPFIQLTPKIRRFKRSSILNLKTAKGAK